MEFIRGSELVASYEKQEVIDEILKHAQTCIYASDIVSITGYGKQIVYEVLKDHYGPIRDYAKRARIFRILINKKVSYNSIGEAFNVDGDSIRKLLREYEQAENKRIKKYSVELINKIKKLKRKHYTHEEIANKLSLRKSVVGYIITSIKDKSILKQHGVRKVYFVEYMKIISFKKQGWKNSKIAEELGLADRTIRRYVKKSGIDFTIIEKTEVISPKKKHYVNKLTGKKL